ncbi:MAG: hypothetical protein U0183_00395 [Polyangiaceae bacterium]
MRARYRWSTGLGILAALGTLSGCATLEDITPNQCGNQVVEEGEDCDPPSSEDATTTCAPVGARNACRYQCEKEADCPAGWGCDLNEATCVKGTDRFDLKLTDESGSVRMVSGDFDGDGRKDLVLTQPSGLDGSSSGVGLFFEEGMTLRERYPIPIALGALDPVPSKLLSDAILKKDRNASVPAAEFPLTDLGFASSFGVGVLRGSPEAPFVPELFPYQVLEVGGQKASQIIVVPQPADKGGSFRGRVSYFVAFGAADAPGGARGTQILPFNINKAAQGAAAYTVIPGNPQDVRFAKSPTGEAICFRAESCSQVLVYSKSQQSTAVVLLEAPDIDSTAPPAPRIAPRIDVPGGADSVAIGDVDGDGIPDVVIGPRGTGCPLLVKGSAIRQNQLAPVAVSANECQRGQSFLGLVDLNGDDIADYVYSASVVASQKNGPNVGFAPVYSRGTTPWTQIETGDFDGDGRLDAILAVQGQSGIDVLRGTKGEVRPLTIQTPEPVDLMTVGFFDADRAVDIAYTTKVGRKNKEASAYIRFGGAEDVTVPIGRKNVSQIVNLRRPLAEPVLPDVDFLGLVQDSEVTAGAGVDASKAVLFTTYVPQGRSPVSLLKRSPGEGIAGRAAAFGSFVEPGRFEAIQAVLPGAGKCEKQGANVLDDLLEPPLGGTTSTLSRAELPYGPLLPVAFAASHKGDARDEVFSAVVVEGGTLAINRIDVSPRGAQPYAPTTVFKTPYVPVAGLCPLPNPKTDALYPHEKLALLDVDDDGDLDIVFSDGGRLEIQGQPKEKPGVMIVLRNDGGTYVPMPAPGLVGRSFTRIRLSGNKSALAVLTPTEVAFYRAENGALVKLTPSGKTDNVLLQKRDDARAIEAGDFDGDGVEDLAILAGGVLQVAAGKQASAGAALEKAGTNE